MSAPLTPARVGEAKAEVRQLSSTHRNRTLIFVSPQTLHLGAASALSLAARWLRAARRGRRGMTNPQRKRKATIAALEGCRGRYGRSASKLSGGRTPGGGRLGLLVVCRQQFQSVFIRFPSDRAAFPRGSRGAGGCERAALKEAPRRRAGCSAERPRIDFRQAGAGVEPGRARNSIHLQAFRHRLSALRQRHGQVIAKHTHASQTLGHRAFFLIHGGGAKTPASLRKSPEQKLFAGHHISIVPAIQRCQALRDLHQSRTDWHGVSRRCATASQEFTPDRRSLSVRRAGTA